jgi:hypothetical protein
VVLGADLEARARCGSILFLRFELLDECSEMRGDGGHNGVVLVLEALPNLLTAQSVPSVAASDSANTPIIALDGHGPAVPAIPIPVITVVAIASVLIALTITRATDFNPEAGSLNIRTLSEGRHRGHSSHCTQEAERDQRSNNPLHVAFLLFCLSS